MYLVLIAQDYAGQHSELINELKSADIPYITCKNDEIDISIAAIQNDPDLVIFNSSKLSSGAIRQLCEGAEYKVQPQKLVNIYTYGGNNDQNEYECVHSSSRTAFVRIVIILPFSHEKACDQIDHRHSKKKASEIHEKTHPYITVLQKHVLIRIAVNKLSKHRHERQRCVKKAYYNTRSHASAVAARTFCKPAVNEKNRQYVYSCICTE